MGFFVIKHTDGNIMPIIDQLVEANPHAFHSLDPQAGVYIAEVGRLYGDKVCLIGNVKLWPHGYRNYRRCNSVGTIRA